MQKKPRGLSLQERLVRVQHELLAATRRLGEGKPNHAASNIVNANAQLDDILDDLNGTEHEKPTVSQGKDRSATKQ